MNDSLYDFDEPPGPGGAMAWVILGLTFALGVAVGGAIAVLIG